MRSPGNKHYQEAAASSAQATATSAVRHSRDRKVKVVHQAALELPRRVHRVVVGAPHLADRLHKLGVEVKAHACTGREGGRRGSGDALENEVARQSQAAPAVMQGAGDRPAEEAAQQSDGAGAWPGPAQAHL